MANDAEMGDEAGLFVARQIDMLSAIVLFSALSIRRIENAVPAFGMGKLADFFRSRAASGA